MITSHTRRSRQFSGNSLYAITIISCSACAGNGGNNTGGIYFTYPVVIAIGNIVIPKAIESHRVRPIQFCMSSQYCIAIITVSAVTRNGGNDTLRMGVV